MIRILMTRLQKVDGYRSKDNLKRRNDVVNEGRGFVATATTLQLPAQGILELALKQMRQRLQARLEKSLFVKKK